MFANTLPPEEKMNFVNHLIKGLQGFLPAPIPKSIHYAQGPPTETWKPVVIPSIPEIKFEGKIWDSATMLPSDDLRLYAGSPAFVPR